VNKQDIILKLRDIKPLLYKKYGVTELALFGSYSRDEQTPQSDIDILVDTNVPHGFSFLNIVYELDALFDKEVQVVSKGAIKPKYFASIKPDLIYV
jgi:predicted nucleotidyltransferase